MAVQILEKIITGENDVERIYQMASRKGVDVIKLLWSRRGESVARVTGFYVPVLNEKDKQNSMIQKHARVESVSVAVGMEFGELNFYPDSDGFRWGYVLDTKENREVLMYGLKKPWYTIQNENVREKIISMAEAEGLPTEYSKVTHEYVKKTQEQSDLEKENEELKKLLTAQKKKSTILEKKMQKNEEELAMVKLDSKAKNKPLKDSRNIEDDPEAIIDEAKQK